MHVLRCVADAQARGAHHLAAARPDDAEQHADQGRFTRAIESNQGHDLPGVDREIHRFEHVARRPKGTLTPRASTSGRVCSVSLGGG